MYEHEFEILNLYKDGKVTEYILCQELSHFLGAGSEVRIHDAKVANTASSFGVFVVPDFRVNGITLVYYIDKDALMNFYSSEELLERLAQIAASKQGIIKEGFKFIKDHEDAFVSFSDAMACLLRIYQSILPILYIEGKDFLPTDEKIGGIVNDFEDGNKISESLEFLFVSNILPREIVDYAKKMQHDSSDSPVVKIQFAKIDEIPSVNLGQQEIRQNVTSTFGTREHKEIPYDYKPLTNQ